MADGEAIDWAEVERRLSPLPEARKVDGLKLIESLGESWHGPRERLSGEAAPPSPGLWLLLALAVLQVAFAVLGGLAGPPKASDVPALPVLLTMVVFVGAGLVLARAGKRDRRALSLAGFFLCVACAPAQRFLGPAATLLDSYPAVHALAAAARALAALLPEAFLPFFLWRFTREFPRTVRLDRWAPVVEGALWVSGAGGIVLFAVNAVARLSPWHDPALFARLAPLLRGTTNFYWIFLSALCLPALFLAAVRCRATDSEERRRVRWFLAGLALGVAPLFAVVLGESLSPTFTDWMDIPAVRRFASVLMYCLLLTVPLSTTYAILAHRLLSVRLVLRNAARFALARFSTLALGVVPSAALLLCLYQGRDRKLSVILSTAPAPLLLAAAAAGWILYSLRGTLLRRLEELLVGRRQDPSLVLASFGRVAQNARTAAELSQLVRDRLAELVAAGSAGLLVRDRAGVSYVPAEPGLRPLAAASGLVRIVEASPEPVSLSAEDRGSLLRWLAEEDRHWVADCDAHLVTSLAGSRGETLALLVLGAARGGLPYAREEQRAVTALAAAASLALEHIVGRDSAAGGGEAMDEPAGECRDCGRVGPHAQGRCVCGRPLAPASIPFELAGKFRLEAVLGAGGMGVVYRAADLALERVVALKTLPRLGSEALLRLRREARSMAGFLHPNLALIFGAETWRGVPVLVVEYLAGGTLASRLGTPLPPREVLRLAADLAAGLEAMHGKGLLHRDVKPSNIGFTGDGVPKLLDFGLARIRAEALPELADPALPPGSGPPLTRTGQIAGTPLYMSPQALAGEGPAAAHDLWSLHLVLWEATAGRHPLADVPLPAALRRQAAGEVPDVRTVRPGCPEEIALLLARGLDPDPRSRPPTAGAVRLAALRALERLEPGGEPVRDQPPLR